MNSYSEALNSLKRELHDMFQVQNNDLDFGIFRILNIKRNEIEEFIDNKLSKVVEEAISDVAEKLYNKQLEQVKEYVEEYGGKRIRESLENIKEEALTLIDFLQTEDKEELIPPLKTDPEKIKEQLGYRVYNHIHSFFALYYRDGDFGYNDRSTNQYKVNYPDEVDYIGSDILFHWKHQDSYYVKTAASFNSISFKLEDKRIEYRLEGKAISNIVQNSNQENIKHYRFDRIEPPKPADVKQTWRVILNLSEKSTSKVEIFREMNAQIFGESEDVGIYLHEPPKKHEEQIKPIFTELQDSYNKVENGRPKGINYLHTSLGTYAEKLSRHPDFKGLGKNKSQRQDALVINPKVIRFHTFDKNLNRFILGMDSDYFIHKDLNKFLKTEQRRFIQNVILGDLDALLNLSPENPSFAIAKAFQQVTDELISLLVTFETFQKQLFLMKKKVISTNYLTDISQLGV